VLCRLANVPVLHLRRGVTIVADDRIAPSVLDDGDPSVGIEPAGEVVAADAQRSIGHSAAGERSAEQREDPPVD